MRNLFFFVVLTICCVGMNAQIDSITVKNADSGITYKVALKDLVLGMEDKVSKIDSVSWFRKNRIGFDINEVAFVNWNAGGTNSISGLLNVEIARNYKRKYTVWDNRIAARFGINHQDKVGLRKTDDILEFYSTFGYRKDTTSNWFTSANLSFKTQFGHGYSYSSDAKKVISGFMAPAYLYLGVGTIYTRNVKKFTAYLSPITLKSTFVLNQDLANLGSFGVTPAIYDDQGNVIKEGKKIRKELGILVTSTFGKEIYKNISFRNIMSFYTDYVNDFGNVDVDWEFAFDFRVNNYIRAVLGSHLKYDDDVKITEVLDGEEVQVSGAKVQWKQHLGIGVVYDF